MQPGTKLIIVRAVYDNEGKNSTTGYILPQNETTNPVNLTGGMPVATFFAQEGIPLQMAMNLFPYSFIPMNGMEAKDWNEPFRFATFPPNIQGLANLIGRPVEEFFSIDGKNAHFSCRVDPSS